MSRLLLLTLLVVTGAVFAAQAEEKPSDMNGMEMQHGK
jgi:hypothetical protein